MKIAKCYLARGRWRYYRTDDGHTFSVRDGQQYFYHGNVFKAGEPVVYIKPNQHKELFEKISFED